MELASAVAGIRMVFPSNDYKLRLLTDGTAHSLLRNLQLDMQQDSVAGTPFVGLYRSGIVSLRAWS